MGEAQFDSNGTLVDAAAISLLLLGRSLLPTRRIGQQLIPSIKNGNQACFCLLFNLDDFVEIMCSSMSVVLRSVVLCVVCNNDNNNNNLSRKMI